MDDDPLALAVQTFLKTEYPPARTPFEEHAERIVDREEDEGAWLAARRTMVTASESAHVLGLTKKEFWGIGPRELAKRKRGPADEVGPAAHAGRWWEDADLAWLSFSTGLPLLPLSSLFRSRRSPSMGATPDGYVVPEGLDAAAALRDPEKTVRYLTVCDGFDDYEGEEALEKLWEHVMGSDTPVLVESKHQPSRKRSHWKKSGKPKPWYVNQLRHQMYVMGCDRGILYAKVDANEMYCHLYERDPSYDELLVQSCDAFHAKYLAGDE